MRKHRVSSRILIQLFGRRFQPCHCPGQGRFGTVILLHTLLLTQAFLRMGFGPLRPGFVNLPWAFRRGHQKNGIVRHHLGKSLADNHVIPLPLYTVPYCCLLYTSQYDIVEAAVAEKAIPYCNIVCITGEEMKSSVQGYFQVLFDQNPQSVGGALPGDDFYYLGQ